jgi:hypothetical protein
MQWDADQAPKSDDLPIMPIMKKKPIIKKKVQFETPPPDTFTIEPYSLRLKREPDPTRLLKSDTCVPDLIAGLPCPPVKTPRPQNLLF